MQLRISTERLILRRFTLEDTSSLLDFITHPSVAKAVPEIQPSEAGAIAYIDMQNGYDPFALDKCFDLAIERKRDGQLMGILTMVCREPKQGEIGYALGIGFRRQGYAAEAARGLTDYGFNSLGLQRIHANTDSGNPDSRRVMERLGMRQEGHLRQAAFADGQWLDVWIYGITAEEWQRSATPK